MLTDQTKFPQLVHAATKAYGKGTEAAVGAVCKLLECLRYALMYKDITGTSHVTKEFLTGARQKAGYAHTIFKRIAFLEFVYTIIITSNEPHANEVRDTIFPMMKTCSSFVASFAAGVKDAESTEPAAVGAEGEDDVIEIVSPWTGLASATSGTH